MTSWLRRKLASLSRGAKYVLVIAADSMLLPVALYAGYVLRLGEPFPRIEPVWWLFLSLPLISIPIMALFGVYRVVLRYMGMGTLIAIVKAMLLATLILAALVFVFSGIHEVPRSVLPIFFVLSVIALGGARLLLREFLSGSVSAQAREPVAIYGAGAAGRQLAIALSRSREFRPVLFLDDARQVQGREVQGLRVHPPEKLGGLIEQQGISRVLVALPSVPRSRQREILRFIEPFAVKVMAMPGLPELAEGRKRVDDLREVGIDDLLGREPVTPDPQLLHACVRGRNVMVTGAGGSIGAELCRQILALHPRRLLLFELSELALYSIDRELRDFLAGRRDIEIVPVLGSVQDAGRLEGAMKAWEIETVYHAAAYKHVPLVEHNPFEGLRNNTVGTWRAAEAAIAARVRSFVLISTDKAVRPTNVMGASKRLAEMVLQALAREQDKTQFCMVRFGNVLASSGSVVPLFKEQIRNGGPVTVTHREIVRFFMTIPEAAQLVIQAGSMGKSGEVFVLDMGEPVLIRDLAERMIHLSGLRLRDATHPDGDIEVAFTGLRPGEKLYEELLIADTDLTTSHPRIRCAQEEFLPWSELEPALRHLQQAMDQVDFAGTERLLKGLVHGYRPEGSIADNVWSDPAQTGSAA